MLRDDERALGIRERAAELRYVLQQLATRLYISCYAREPEVSELRDATVHTTKCARRYNSTSLAGLQQHAQIVQAQLILSSY